MKKQSYIITMLLLLALTSNIFTGCITDPPNPPNPSNPCKDSIQTDSLPCFTRQIDRLPWYNWHPEKATPDFTTQMAPLRLAHGDSVIVVSFPQSTETYRRAILTYRMGAWGERPGEWDMNTIVTIKNKADGKIYEFARAVTAYGNSFGPDWSKTYFLDVTEYLPMMTGDTEITVNYGGYDATDKRAHNLTLTFDFYNGEPINTPIYNQNIYYSKGSWLYGSKDPSQDIESPERLGIRNFTVPENVNSLLMKVSITGHGHDQGVFPDRPGYKTRNAAEFDENFYDVVVNGQSKGKGQIFYKNDTTYAQAGTYKFDRAGWGPGLPINIQYWTIDNLPEDRNMSIDFNLDRFISIKETGSNAKFIIRVDVFGYARKEKQTN